MVNEDECKTAGKDCHFRLRTDNEYELFSFTQQHVKKMHKKEVSKAEVLKLAKKV
jgi:predicted small metal-binding protein